MTIEVTPIGVQCNLRCEYCYENPMRDNIKYDKPEWQKIKLGLERQGGSFTVFGGEGLLIPLDELEELWKWGFEKFKKNGIQTNGSLITDKHIELFEKYNVHVGVSVDGPEELNDARRAPSGKLEATRTLTARTNHNLRRLILHPKINTSVILTLHRLNASPERLARLISWFHQLDEIGLSSCRLHLMENDNANHLLLDEDNLYKALITLEQQEFTNLKFDRFDEMLKQLQGGNGGCCVYQGCDPLNTRAVQGVGPSGQPLNCGRVNKTGIDYIKASGPEPTRALVLRNTPQSDGGCKDCEYWYACQGFCPGTGVQGDWRNRTEYCSLLKRLFSYLAEKHGIELKKDLPTYDPNCEGHGDTPHENSHGDSYVDDAHGDGFTHGDTDHGDIPHADRTMLKPLEVRK
jgi:uncharacterized protein